MRSVGPLCLAISIPLNPALLILCFVALLFLLYLTSHLFVPLARFASLTSSLLVGIHSFCKPFHNHHFSFISCFTTDSLKCSPVDACLLKAKRNLSRLGNRDLYHTTRSWCSRGNQPSQSTYTDNSSNSHRDSLMLDSVVT